MPGWSSSLYHWTVKIQVFVYQTYYKVITQRGAARHKVRLWDCVFVEMKGIRYSRFNRCDTRCCIRRNKTNIYIFIAQLLPRVSPWQSIAKVYGRRRIREKNLILSKSNMELNWVSVWANGGYTSATFMDEFNLRHDEHCFKYLHLFFFFKFQSLWLLCLFSRYCVIHKNQYTKHFYQSFVFEWIPYLQCHQNTFSNLVNSNPITFNKWQYVCQI